MPNFVPVTGSVLEWAMADAGLDESSLASAIDVEPDLVSAWISETEQPQTGQFRKLAKVLNRPTLFLLQAAPPSAAGSPANFRRFAGQAPTRSFLPEEEKGMRTGRQLQNVVAWVREQTGEPPSPLLPDTPNSASEAGALLRQRLDWPLSEQISAPTTSKAIGQVRQRLEEAGLLVMFLSMKRDGCRGFTVFHPYAPLVAVNTAQTMEARLFTLLHETAHVVRQQSAVDEPSDPESVDETWCDTFAASFLLPSTPFRSFVEAEFGGNLANLSEAGRVARRFKASLAATCLRSDQLGLSSYLYSQLPFYHHLPEESDSGFNPDPSTAGKRLREYGLGIIEPILEARDAGILRQHDVQRYLKVTDDKFADLAARVASAGGSRADTYAEADGE